MFDDDADWWINHIRDIKNVQRHDAGVYEALVAANANNKTNSGQYRHTDRQTDRHTDIYTGWAKKSKPDNFSITLSTASQFS